MLACTVYLQDNAIEIKCAIALRLSYLYGKKIPLIKGEVLRVKKLHHILVEEKRRRIEENLKDFNVPLKLLQK